MKLTSATQHLDSRIVPASRGMKGKNFSLSRVSPSTTCNLADFSTYVQTWISNKWSCYIFVVHTPHDRGYLFMSPKGRTVDKLPNIKCSEEMNRIECHTFISDLLSDCIEKFPRLKEMMCIDRDYQVIFLSGYQKIKSANLGLNALRVIRTRW